MKRTTPIFLVVLALGLVLALGCERAEAPAADEPLVLRSYAVPAGMQNDVERTINQVLRLGEDKQVGRAEAAPDGTLLVAVPEAYHEGVRSFIEQLSADRGGLERVSNIRVDAWIVLGKKVAAAPDLSGFGDLRPALEAIVESQGNLEFLVAERLGGSVLVGNSVRLQGGVAELELWARALEDAIQLTVELDTRLGPDLRSTIRAKEGETIVLGQAVAPIGNHRQFGRWAYGEGQAGGEDLDPVDHPTVYFVLRTSRNR